MYNNYCVKLSDSAESLLKKGEFLGKGHNGIVYSLPENRIIKIFKDPRVCKKEYDILKRVRKSKFFPKVYDYGTYYIVREYVAGHRLDKYIKKNGINKNISLNLISLITEFTRLKFKKLDIRCKDLYLQEDFSIRVIDPKNNYSKKVIYPRHLMKGLNKLGVLDDFLEVVREADPKSYKLWSFRMTEYLEKGIK